MVELKVGFHHECLGSDHRNPRVVKLVTRLHHGSLKVVKVEVWLHQGSFIREQEVS